MVTFLYVTRTFVMLPPGILCHTCRLTTGNEGVNSIPTRKQTAMLIQYLISKSN